MGVHTTLRRPFSDIANLGLDVGIGKAPPLDVGPAGVLN